MKPAHIDLIRTGSCAVALVIAVGALAGWLFTVPVLQSVLPGLTTMKANTAVGLALCAVGLLRLDVRSIAVLCGGSAALLGAATLVEYVFGLRLGLDEALFADPITTSQPFPGRMSPATAIGFVALGCSLPMLACGRSRATLVAAHVLALVPGAIAYLSLVGYLYGVERLYNFGPYVSVALHTAVGLGLLAVASLLTRQREGWTSPFRDRPIARGVLARLIFISLLLPFATGLLVQGGVALGFYQPLFGPALFAMFASGAFLWIAFQAALTVRTAEDAMLAAREDAKAKAKALRASDERYQVVLDNLPQLVWKTNTAGELLFVNRRWRDYTDLRFDEIGGWRWLDLVHPDDRGRTLDHWRGALARSHDYEIEYRLRGGDGTHRWFKAVGAPICDSTDGGEYWIGSLTDMQEVVEARNVLTRSGEDLERIVANRTNDLVAVQEQLRQSQKMEAVGQLTGGLAHDFNNLLTGVIGGLDLLQHRIARGRVDDLDRHIASARGAAERAASLTHRLLAFSRRQTLDPKPTDAKRLIAGMEDLVRRTMGPGIAVECKGEDDLWTTLCDPPQLENALLNLCINARDAMPDGGRVTIETANTSIDDRAARERDVAPGPYVRISVTDTGTGMPLDVVERAFDPFFTTKPIGLGTGLGLSMIYGFTRQSGGQVSIDSRPGAGTSVSMYLPRDQRREAAVEPAPRPHDLVPVASGDTVLIVDDEPTIRTLVTEVCGDLGYVALQAVDGIAALAVLRSSARIDLLVTDVGLPGGLNGRQVADAARIVRPDLQVLFITGYAETSIFGNNPLDQGMRVLAKPFAMDAIGGQIRAMIAAGRA